MKQAKWSLNTFADHYLRCINSLLRFSWQFGCMKSTQTKLWKKSQKKRNWNFRRSKPSTEDQKFCKNHKQQQRPLLQTSPASKKKTSFKFLKMSLSICWRVCCHQRLKLPSVRIRASLSWNPQHGWKSLNWLQCSISTRYLMILLQTLLHGRNLSRNQMCHFLSRISHKCLNFLKFSCIEH